MSDLIDRQFCFHSSMKYEYFMRNTVGCLHVVRICSFMKEIKVNRCASYITFLFINPFNPRQFITISILLTLLKQNDAFGNEN